MRKIIKDVYLIFIVQVLHVNMKILLNLNWKIIVINIMLISGFSFNSLSLSRVVTWLYPRVIERSVKKNIFFIKAAQI